MIIILPDYSAEHAAQSDTKAHGWVCKKNGMMNLNQGNAEKKEDGGLIMKLKL
jgi:hypothetical protein